MPIYLYVTCGYFYTTLTETGESTKTEKIYCLILRKGMMTSVPEDGHGLKDTHHPLATMQTHSESKRNVKYLTTSDKGMVLLHTLVSCFTQFLPWASQNTSVT